MTTAADVRVAVTGAIYNAVVGTALPATPHVALDSAFLARELGYLTEDGIVQAIGEETTEIKAWQNGDVVRKIRTTQDLTYSLALMETSPLTLETYYGNYTATDSTQGVSNITGDELDHASWIFHVLDGDARIRVVVPDGQITERGETALVNGDALSYPITITAYPVLGIKAYVLLDRDINTSS